MSRSFSALRVMRAALTGLCALTIQIGIGNSAVAQTISTVAGTTDIAGRPARLISVNPAGLLMAPDGSVYVSDNLHAQVLRFDPITHTFSVIAGTAVAGYAGDGGPATSAQLNSPGALALDGAGNLLIAEKGNGRIRKVNLASGQISTVAGGGWSSHDGDWAINARLDGPAGIAVGTDGSIYVSEFEANRVRRVAPNGQIFTIAGTGTQGPSGDEGPAVLAQLARPSALKFDALGNLYISDQANWAIRMIDATGIIHRFAGTGTPAPEVYDGFPALESPLASVTAMAFDAQGNLIYTDHPIGRVRKIDAITHLVSTIGGTGWEFEGVPATNGRIDMPDGLALASNGDIYISSQGRSLMQRISGMTGMLEVMAGNGVYHFSGDGGSALLAQILPSNSVVNTAGDIFIADDSRIRKVDHNTGMISTYAGGAECCSGGDGGPAIGASLYGVKSLAIDGSGNLYLNDNGTHRIRKINAATGIISHYAGTGYGSSGDNGPAINATMTYIRDLAADAAGNLFILADNTSRVRRVDAATGIITTIAGNGQTSGPLNDGSLATQVAVPYPDAVAVDLQGNVYVTSQLRIRKIAAATGIITTIAGNGTSGDAGDGGPAINASLNLYDIVVDVAGNIFVIGFETNRIRKIDAVTGIITTVAGTGAAGYSGDGGSPLLAQLHNPRSLGLSPAGDLLVNETFHVRSIAGVTSLPPPPAPDTTPPIIAPTVYGTQLNASGWYASKVDIYWSINDPESNIMTSGCANVALLNDGIFDMPCSATSAGGTVSQTVSIKIDKTPPTATVAMPASGGTYSFGSVVTASYTCGDSTSGISSCSGTVPTGSAIDTATAGSKTFSIAVTDVAGNVSTKMVSYTVSQPDTTPPNISYNLSAATTSAAGWHNTNVTVSWSLYDQESSITSSVGCTPIAVTTDTSGLTLTCTATSGGGTASKSVTIKRDTVAPTITYGAPTPAPNSAGWHNTDPSMPYTKSDDRSGIPGSTTGAISMIGQGANVRYSIGFIDVAGNQGGGFTPAVNIDKIAPFANITSPSNGATYAVGSIVNAAYSCSDGDSGVSTCAGAVPNGSAIDTTTSGTKTFSVTTTDIAGNVATISRTYTVGTVTPPPPPPPPPGTPTYCSSRGNTSSYEWIKSLQVGSWINTSNNNSGYGNFTANTPVSLVRGANSFVLSPGFMSGSSYVENWRVWIDLNQNGTFDTSELLYTGSSSGALSSSLTIPSTALAGTTRMRVSMKWGQVSTACESFTYGEVEDYRVTIP